VSDPIAHLEASLQAMWDTDTATVYADLLGSRGDPRGELIAIDLALARQDSAELRARKHELLTAWIGGDKIGDTPWHPRNFEHGLLRGFTLAAAAKQPITERFQMLLDSAIGTSIRGLTVYGSAAELGKIIDMLAARPLPWLRRLEIQRVGGKRVFSTARVAALEAAVPHVDDLTIQGTRVMATPIPRSVRTLRLVGGEAIVIAREPLAHVTTLDLAFEDPDSWGPVNTAAHVALAALVNPRTFPALRVLDLSRNERRRYGGEGQPDSLPDFLVAIEGLERLERVRLPSVHEGACRYVLDTLARCPQLSIEIARMYVTIEDFVHPRLRVPPPRVWPVPATVHGRDALHVDVPSVQYGDELALSSIVRDLEDQFDTMPAAAREAWLAVWAFLDGLGWEHEDGSSIVLPFDAATLFTALDALDGNRRCDDVAKLIADAKLVPGTDVAISRYWGW
jgi:hypothetical protein